MNSDRGISGFVLNNIVWRYDIVLHCRIIYVMATLNDIIVN